MKRRTYLQAGGSGLAAALAGCVDSIGGGGRDGLHTMETEGSVITATFEYGRDQAVWEDRGVDLSFEVAAFGKYNRQVVSGNSDIGAPSTVGQLKFIDKGEELSFVGQQLNMFNRIFASADDESIEDPSDLAGKKVGLPASRTSTTSTTHRVLVEDEYGVDLIDDTAETRAAPPATLWEFLQQGDLDAISEFSGFTIKGMASDSVKTVFDPHQYWQDREGAALPTTTYTVKRDWLGDNPGAVDGFLKGWQDAVAAMQENAGEALEEYGDVAGITSEAEADIVETLITDGVLYSPVYFDDASVEANWAFVELLEGAGVIEDTPDRDSAFVSGPELESMME
jgi:ABC-type nitrate/sulfonate/bicarbonate transport system substrate-binding protein